MNLLLPLSLGRRQQHTAPCRIMFGPHETNLGAGRTLSDRHVAYYQRRAAGGAGIIVMEEASVHDSDWPYERAPLARLCGPGWRAITDHITPVELHPWPWLRRPNPGTLVSFSAWSGTSFRDRRKRS